MKWNPDTPLRNAIRSRVGENAIPSRADENATPSRADDDELARVVEAFLADLEAGRPVDPERLVAEHPAIAEPLRACLASLEFVERAAGTLSDPTAPEPRTAEARAAEPRAADPQAAAPRAADLPGAAPAPRLGDYRILREVGRGGMGIVYEAEQLSLGRRVALKVLPFAAVLDPRQLQRFKIEAQAAAQLHHTNIVPVYSVGCERGVHYYAMQFIDGRTLAGVVHELRQIAGLEPRGAAPAPSAPAPAASAVIAPFGDVSPPGSTRTPAFFRSAAVLGVQAAEALEHAHAAGIVHRDVKPSNLLLDAKGNLWITDFGLARFPGEGSLTLSGDVLGTLRYMSPEQALAKHALVDHRSDVYSLGATLHELVTLEAMVKGSDREEILRRITFDEPLPPRRLNGAVPLELETIIQKATAKEPERRYATARELADDLRRFLEDKPILARRPTLIERVARWSRRHRTAVRAAMVVLVLAVVGLTASTLLVYRAERATSAALSRAETNFEKARGVVDRMLTWAAEDPLAKAPHMEPMRKRLLEEALEFYRGFLEERGEDPEVRRGTALAHRRVGEIYRLLGEHAKAEGEFREAVARLEALVAEGPGEPAYKQGLMETRRSLSGLLRHLRRFPEAGDALKKSIELGEELAASNPQGLAGKLELANGYGELGALSWAEGQLEAGEKAYRKALETLQELEKRSPESPDCQRTISNVHHNFGMLLKDMGRFPEAEHSYRQALAGRKKRSQANPSPETYYEEATSQFSLGVVLFDLKRFDQAREAYEEALVLQSKLAAAHPGVPRYKDEQASTYNSLGGLELTTGRPVEGEKAFAEALSIQEKLVGAFPQVPDYRKELARSHNNFGILLQDTLQKPAEAQDHYGRARDIFTRLTGEFPDSVDFKEGLGQSLNNLGDVLHKSGKLEEALDALSQARKLFLAAAQLSPKGPDYPGYAIMAGYNLGMVEQALGHLQEARQVLEDALAESERGAKAFPSDPRFFGYMGPLNDGLAAVLSRLKDHAGIARCGEALAKLPGAAGQELYAAASLLGRAAKLAEGQESNEYADRALTLVAEAVRRGFTDLEGLKTNEDLEPVKARKEFQELIERLESQRHGEGSLK